MTVEADGGVQITYLPEMLEGQVAILSAGLLNASESLAVLDALKASALFREDQYSYVLYPNKSLPRFLDKNNIDPKALAGSALLTKLVEDGNADIVTQDCLGGHHFNGNFNNVKALRAALANLPSPYDALVESDQKDVEAIYEGIFNHKAFTGRSGTFFGYEGLGSITGTWSPSCVWRHLRSQRPRWNATRRLKWWGVCSTTISKSTQGSARTSRPNSTALSQPTHTRTRQEAKAPNSLA